MDENKKKQIINAHTHVFTRHFLPPFLAKTYLPYPLYKIFHVPTMLKLIGNYYRRKNKRIYGEIRPKSGGKADFSKRDAQSRKIRRQYKRNIALERNGILKLLYSMVVIVCSIYVTISLFDWIRDVVRPPENNFLVKQLMALENLLRSGDLSLIMKLWFQIPIVILALLYFKTVRNVVAIVLSSIWSFLKNIPGKNTKHLAERYLLMGRFATYNNQYKIAERVIDQLPQGSGIVILPMDMQYMDAGDVSFTMKNKHEVKVKIEDAYRYQMEDLYKMRENNKGIYYPFIFVDPRRIIDERETRNQWLKEHENGVIPEGEEEPQEYFAYDFNPDSGEVSLKDCFIKEYIEEKKFNGIKIYPALGYYPFDEELLALWKYAADHQIPIMTHCVHGTIFYRGKKKEEWDYHPVLQERIGKNLTPMLNPQIKSVDLQYIFTHPLNYLCLLDEELLRILVGKAKSDRVRALFGYNGPDKRMKRNLSHLKICFAHFGGEEEWTRYMEQDRSPHSRELMQHPERGISFRKVGGDLSWFKLEDIWKNADWYSLIVSLMLQYDNVYADISYIISKKSIQPLLKHTLSMEKGFQEQSQVSRSIAKLQRSGQSVDETLRKGSLVRQNKVRARVLFGTDFYVVRNHKSDKDLLVDLKSLLSEEEFDLIARENTHDYLNL